MPAGLFLRQAGAGGHGLYHKRGGLMSFDKAIAYGKEKRNPYRGGKAVAPSCRNHGDCSFCQGNRLYTYQKSLLKMKQREEEYAAVAQWQSGFE